MPSEKILEARRERRFKCRKEKFDTRLNVYNNPFKVTNFNHMMISTDKSKVGTSWKPSVQKWQMNEFINILLAIDEINSLSTDPLIFHKFRIGERGKMRDIQSVDVKERVNQHSLVDNVCYPLLTTSFIYDNAASIVGKGVSFTLDRVCDHLHKIYRYNGFSNDVYVVLVDLHSFFASIDHDTLYSFIDKYITDEVISVKIHQIVDSFDEGLGLGCQLSQILSLLYLNKLDHYIEEVIRCRYYSRFMDDFMLCFQTLEEAELALELIVAELNKIKIDINVKKTNIVHLSTSSFTFLKKKFTLTETGKVVIHDASKSGKNMRHKLRKLRTVLDRGEIDILYIHQLISSWLGMKQKYMSYKYLRKFIDYTYDLFPELRNDNILSSQILDMTNETRLPGEIIVPEHQKYVFNS